MDPSRGQHQEIMANPSSETMSVNSKGHQKPKLPQPEHALNCPRCDSKNTKFCYYNNYSLSQPRYFCKSCKRYWTQGGTMRNVPVGGGCRKNKRSSSKRTHDHQALSSNITNPLMINTHHNIPSLIYDHNHIDTNDLTSAFARLQKQHDYHHHDGDGHLSILGNPSLNPVFFGNQNNFQSFCNYGFGNENFGEFDNGGGSVDFNLETMIPYNNEEILDSTTTTTTTTSDVATTTMKHDLDHVRESALLWGLPWQLIADHGNNNNNMVGDWHGVLNSGLMM